MHNIKQYLRPNIFIEKPHWLLNGLAWLAFYLLCWYLYKDYGVTTDEPIHLTRVDQYFGLWRDILTNGEVRRVESGMRYGILFNLLAHPFILMFSENNVFVLRAYEIKHIVTFHVAFLMYGALAYAFAKAFNYRYAGVLAIGVLALHPSIFGHSFFNPKDIPFAATYTLASIWLACRCIHISDTLKQPRHWRYFVMQGLIIALLVALASGVRIAGAAVLPCWALVLFVLLGWGGIIRSKKNLVILMLSTAAFTCLFLFILYPSVLFGLIEWSADTLKFLNHNPVFRHVLKDTYRIMPLQFFSKTPIILLLFGLMGIVIFLLRYYKLPSIARAIGLMLLGQMLILPILMIILNTQVYNQDRHFLFVYPAYCFFAGIAFIALISGCKHYVFKVCIVIGAFSISQPVIAEMIGLHPYQYLYYNEMTRNHIPRKGFAPYWGGSKKALHEWANHYAQDDQHIASRFWFIGVPRSLTQTLYADKKAQHRSKKNGRVVVTGGAIKDKKCKEIHRETRTIGNTTLTLGRVYSCPAPHSQKKPKG